MGKVVLVVDDAAVARTLLRAILVKGEYDVVEADSGAAAIRSYHTLRPAAVTMDLLMDSMNGLVAIQAIRTIDPDARIVVISSTSDANIVQQAIKLGVKAFVAKPFQPATLLAAIEKALVS